MKIICEHCGTNIDLKKDNICPNCKAPYNKNKEFIKYKEEMKAIGKEIFEFDNKAKKQSKIIGMVITMFSVIIIGFVAYNIFKQTKDFEQDIVQNNNESFSFNYEKYELLEKLDNNEHNLFKVKDGYKILLVNISITNDGEEELFVMPNDIICSIDRVKQSEFILPFDEYKQIYGFIENGYTVKGYVAYEVPEDSKSFDLSFKDKTLHIDVE